MSIVCNIEGGKNSIISNSSYSALGMATDAALAKLYKHTNRKGEREN
jgi:hypothetical protein